MDAEILCGAKEGNSSLVGPNENLPDTGYVQEIKSSTVIQDHMDMTLLFGAL
ncbi:hypothetical protein [Pontibacter sp. G13]|uniref:hypothetical protein n=1 Tax=Pontibacter sp. G13 TaxID=3074898 RepID=UPI002889ED71|nr:hypothetical protein [Pontibacter sp. G13]WNJ17404.1 hypothetical protein RJD25_21355 [Pontibacter sp. G13]